MDEEKLHTHYDNLKVTRNAPLEVIKAAYRAMAQKYHPDVNTSPGAERVMKIINEAWDVLSDPVARKKHDQWIEIEEAKTLSTRQHRDHDSTFNTGGARTFEEAPSTPEQPDPNGRPMSPSGVSGKDVKKIGVTAIALLFLAFAINHFGGGEKENQASDEWWKDDLLVARAPVSAQPTALPDESEADEHQSNSSGVPRHSEEELAQLQLENEPSKAAIEDLDHQRLRLARLSPGQALPRATGYIEGSPKKATNGSSKVTVDNTRNISDVVIKVCQGTASTCTQVRHAFVRKGESFSFGTISPGLYDIRYVSLDSGGINKSEAFELVEEVSEEGVRYSVLTITLYTVAGGNTKMTKIEESQF